VIIDSIAPGIAPGIAPAAPRLSVAPLSNLRHVSVGAALRRVKRSALGHAQYRFEMATAGIVRRRLRQYRVFYLLSQRFALRYEPRATFRGHALVVRANVDIDLPWPFDDDLGWKRWVDGALETFGVAGDHVGIMRQPKVRALGEHLSRAFDERAPR
jgi:thioesterase domain-containing protein